MENTKQCKTSNAVIANITKYTQKKPRKKQSTDRALFSRLLRHLSRKWIESYSFNPGATWRQCPGA